MVDDKVMSKNCRIVVSKSDLYKFDSDLNYLAICMYLKGIFSEIEGMSNRELDVYLRDVNNNNIKTIKESGCYYYKTK